MVRPSPQGMTASNKMTQFCCSLFTSVRTGLLVVSGLASCAVNPATGGANLVLMSESREKEVGAEEHAKVLASQPLYQDEALLAYVTEVGNRVAAASPHRRRWTYGHRRHHRSHHEVGEKWTPPGEGGVPLFTNLSKIVKFS